MKAARIAEIENELRAAIPNGVYDANSFVVIECDACHGASDDHKANCYVPLVYELLDEVKRQAGI